MKKLLMILSLSIIVFSCEKNQDIGLPVITLIGPLEVFFDVNAAYVEFGYKATDASGRDISDSVICDLSDLNMSRSGSYQISYIAVDRLGRKSAAVYRTVHVGSGQAPVITIAGDNPVILALNSEFTPPLATAVSSDGNTDLSESVVVNAETVDTSMPGTYSVYYTVSETGGLSTTEILTVYVLESDIPRIVVSGDGTTPENPLIIEQLTFDADVSGEEKQSKAAEAFRKSLPTIKAYDLEDGDISYRVSAMENEAYTAVLQAIIDGSSPVDPVTMTVSDKDGNMSAVDLYISVIADITPPVITIADEPVYEIEIDMWRDQWSEWETDILGKLSVFVSDDGGTTVEVFPKDGTSESDSVATDSGIKCWIEYPRVVNSTDQQEYPNSDLKTTLMFSKGENTNCYYYQTPTHEINTKAVILKAKDTAGNTGEKSIKVFLKDTTPPEILTTQSVVAFGATQYSWDVKDNSGYKTSRSTNIPSYTHNGTNYGSAGLIEGTFSVSFSDTDYARNPVSKTGSLKVNAPSTEDLFSAYGNFSGEDSASNENEGDAQALTPDGWMLADAINAPVDATHIDGLKRYWYENNMAKEITKVTTIGEGFIICGGIRDRKDTARRGYLTCGYRGPVSNVVLGLRSPEVERTLFQNVKYQVSYKHRDFKPKSTTGALAGDRYLVVQRRSGNGNFKDQGTEFRIEWAASSPTGNVEDVITALRNMQTAQQSFIVTGGNITGFSVLYSLKRSGTAFWDGDFGAIIGNIQIKAIDWPKRQNDGSVVSP